MPLYEYHCNGCNHDFEELVLSSSNTAIACPSCTSGDVVKKMSASALGRSSQGLPSCGGGCPGAGGCSTGSCCSHFS